MTCAAAVTFSLLAGPVLAQNAVVQGRVHDEVTGLPLADALVRVDGTSIRSRTDGFGAYRLEAVPYGQATFRVEADRYAPLTQLLHIDHPGPIVLPLTLTPVAHVLERLNIRGTPGPEADATLTRDLVARVPGARVLFHGGGVGQVTRLLLRGVKSLSLPGEPLYYVDGIRVAPPEPASRGRPGTTSILDLIDPESIERVEILPGPAASMTYGLGASNGVILIYTRH